MSDEPTRLATLAQLLDDAANAVFAERPPHLAAFLASYFAARLAAETPEAHEELPSGLPNNALDAAATPAEEVMPLSEEEEELSEEAKLKKLLEEAAARVVELRALAHALDSGHGEHSAVALRCDACASHGSDGDDGNCDGDFIDISRAGSFQVPRLE